MSFNVLAWAGGESRETDIDGATGAPASGWDVVTSPVHSGDAAWRVYADGTQSVTNQMGAITFVNTALGAGSVWVVFASTPGDDFILCGFVNPNYYCLECNTSGQIRLVKLGSTVGTMWSGRTALTGWSTDNIEDDNSTFKHIFYYCDPLTLGSSHVWFGLLIDGVQQWAVDIGTLATNTAFANWMTASGYTPDPDIYAVFDDFAGLSSVSAGDAPHLTAWPVPEIYASHPDADIVQQWTASGGGTGVYTEWNEATAHDSDSSYNKAASTALVQESSTESAADLGVGSHTVATYPYVLVWHRIESGVGSKWGVSALLQNGNSVEMSQPGSSYEGWSSSITRVSGSWSISDIGGYVGLKTADADHDIPERCTKIQVQWALYDSTVQATTTPSLGVRFGAIPTDQLVPASWAGGSRRFGAVPSDEVVNVGTGARRWGAVPSDELVPSDSDWTT